VSEREREAMASATFLEVLLAIFLPPVGVFLRYGCGVSGTLTSPQGHRLLGRVLALFDG
jgi:hypothetical protein